MIKNLTAKYDCHGMYNDEIINILLRDRGIEDLQEFNPDDFAAALFEN